MKTLRNLAMAVGAAFTLHAHAALPDQPARIRLQAYPDPCTEHVTIVLPMELKGHMRADVRDGDGRPVMSWPLGFANTIGTTVTLDTTSLPAGSYVLSVLDESGDVASTPLFVV